MVGDGGEGLGLGELFDGPWFEGMWAAVDAIARSM